MNTVLNLPVVARRPLPLARIVAPVEQTRTMLAADTRRAEPPGQSDTGKVYTHVKTLASQNGPQALDVYF